MKICFFLLFLQFSVVHFLFSSSFYITHTNTHSKNHEIRLINTHTHMSIGISILDSLLFRSFFPVFFTLFFPYSSNCNQNWWKSINSAYYTTNKIPIWILFLLRIIIIQCQKFLEQNGILRWRKEINFFS